MEKYYLIHCYDEREDYVLCKDEQNLAEVALSMFEEVEYEAYCYACLNPVDDPYPAEYPDAETFIKDWDSMKHGTFYYPEWTTVYVY